MAKFRSRHCGRWIGIPILAFTAILGGCLPIHFGKSARVNKLSYHYNPERTGWNDHEAVLQPGTISGSQFGLLWESLPLDYFNDIPPRLYASPLYVDSVQINAGGYRGRTFAALYVVTSTGFAYALSAIPVLDTPPGSVLWRKRLTAKPCEGGAMGNLSTPVIDLERQRLYVTSCDDDAQWQVHALDIRSGEELPGWPVSIDHLALNARGINKNGATQYGLKNEHTQRGALNLSPDGARVYVGFGLDSATGWIVAVDTTLAKVSTAFSVTAKTSEIQGGVWASGGPAVDQEGNVYVSTGASFTQTIRQPGIAGVFPDSEHSWGQSILKLREDLKEGFELEGTYTPFNYCVTAAHDIDIGSSGTVVIDLDPKETATPHLLALGGGKQGNVYLLDRAHLPGGITKRQPCSDDSASDLSLLAPESQPQFGKRGPINVFGPYTDEHAMLEQARSRTTAAYFHSAKGEDYLFVTGSTKKGDNFEESTPPGLARLKIIKEPGKPAYLRVDQLERSQTFENPGSPIVTSDAGRGAVVWILEMNAKKTALYGPHAARPVLYAFDALSFRLLWKSKPGVLGTSGKYNEPAVVNGTVFVGTDRIQAFGLRPSATRLATQDFTPLFDGRTLNHWRGDPALWSVEDGAITGRTNGSNGKNTFLIHEGVYRNFELHFKYRFLSAWGNSGMQYRSHTFPEHEYSVAGYQANVVTLDAKERYAMLVDENARGDLALLGEKTEITERKGKLDRQILGFVNSPSAVWRADKPYPEWNDYVVIAYGNHLVNAVNGLLATDVVDDDFEGRASEGFIALQLSPGPPMGVQFKDIEIKELSAPPELAGRFETHPAPPPSLSNASTVQIGKRVYDQNCALCHSTKESGAPPREALAQLPHDKIVSALKNGVMQAMATKLQLDDADIHAVAAYLNSSGETP